MVSLNAEIFKDGVIQVDILDLEVLIIRRMKIKAQQKIRKTGIFVSKGLFRSNVFLLKTQHHQRMKLNTIKQSLKY